MDALIIGLCMIAAGLCGAWLNARADNKRRER
jgi:hypothetical protein